MRYLERSDFEENGSKDFRRLTSSQPVGLKYGEIVISAVKIHKDKDNIKKIDVEAALATSAPKVKIELQN